MKKLFSKLFRRHRRRMATPIARKEVPPAPPRPPMATMNEQLPMVDAINPWNAQLIEVTEDGETV